MIYCVLDSKMIDNFYKCLKNWGIYIYDKKIYVHLLRTLKFDKYIDINSNELALIIMQRTCPERTES